MVKLTDRIKQNALFWGIFLMVILVRYLILAGFAFIIYDSDQSIMWNAAIDYSRGIFHEPRFYGQTYSTMLEAFFAVPLVWIGVPVYVSLPLVTTLLTILPFFLIALIARSQGKVIQACIILSILVFLPLEYGFLTSIPRGWVPGIFMASLGAMMIYLDGNKKIWFLFGFFAVLSYSVNPNSFLVMAPALLYLTMKNFRSLQFYFSCLAGMMTGLMIHLAVSLFYWLHPGVAFHHGPAWIFEISTLIDSIFHLDRHFGWVTPLFEPHGVMLPVLFLIMGMVLHLQKSKTEAYLVFGSLILILVTLSMNRVYVDTDSVFYSPVRFYLALPFLLALYIPFLRIPFQKVSMVLLLLVSGFFIVRMQDIKPAFNRVMAPGINHFIAVAKLEDFQYKCKQILDFSRKYRITLVVEENDFFYDFINYGCSTCFAGFPATLRPSSERRTWRLKEEKTAVHQNILIVDFSFRMGQELQRIENSGITWFNEQGFYFIMGNKKPTLELLQSLNVEVRRFE